MQTPIRRAEMWSRPPLQYPHWFLTWRILQWTSCRQLRRYTPSAIEIESQNERDAFLDQACGGNDLFRTEVQARVDQYFHATTPTMVSGGASDHPDLEATEAFGSQSDSVGMRIGPYKLLQQIGEGGMGSVWMAEQEQPVRRTVALKIIKAGMDSKQVIARFEAERQALALMNHPNIARVFDAGTTESGQPYFVMELVKGSPITEFCDKNRYTPQQRIRLFVDVCQAVQHAHQKGIIHRDIKPSNVMVMPQGDSPVVKVIDFGLAKATSQKLTERTLFTAFGQIVGTPSYMSPEQAEMSGVDVDTRTDVYSLGALLYELMTGTTPIESKILRKAGIAEIQRMVQQEEAPPLRHRLTSLGDVSKTIAEKRSVDASKLSQLVRGDLNVIVLKALEKDRTRRYATPSDLADDITRFLNNEAIEARPASAFYRLKKLYQRNKLIASSAVLITFTLLIATIVSTSQAIRASVAEAVAENRLSEVENAQQETLAALKKESEANLAATQALYKMNTSFGLMSAEEGRPAEALLWFTEAQKLVVPGSIEDQASRIRHRCWSQVLPIPVRHHVYSDTSILSMNFDPSGQYIATLCNNGHSYIWDIQRDAEPKRVSQGVTCQSWHPTKSILAIATEDLQLKTVEVASSTTRNLSDLREKPTAILFGPKGRTIAVGSKTLRFWDLQMKTFRDSFTHPGDILHLQFSSDGKRILTLCDDKQVRQFLTDGGSEDSTIKPAFHVAHQFPGKPLIKPIYIDQDKGILVKRNGKTAQWIDANTGNLIRDFKIKGNNINAFANRPDGRVFAICDQSGDLQIWDATTGEQMAKSQPGGENWKLAFSPDGLDLVRVSRDRFQRMDSKRGIAYGSAYPLTDGSLIHSPSWSPDGRLIALASTTGSLTVWKWNSFLGFQATLTDQNDLRVSNPRMRSIKLGGRGSRLKHNSGGEFVLACGSNIIFNDLRQITVVSASSGRPAGPVIDRDALILDACLSPDESLIAVAALDHEITFWDRSTGEQIGTTVRIDAEPLRIQFGKDDRCLVVLQADGALQGIDPADGTQLWTQVHPGTPKPEYTRFTHTHMYRDENGFPQMQFEKFQLLRSDDGKRCFSNCNTDSVCIWNTSDGNLIRRLTTDETEVVHIAISNSGDSLVAAGHGTTIWNVHSGEQVGRFMDEQVHYTAFSRDDTRLVSTNEHGEAQILAFTPNTLDLESSTTLSGCFGVFLDDRSQWILLSGKDRRSARVFNARNGTPVTPPMPLSSRATKDGTIWTSGRESALITGATRATNQELGAYIDVLPLNEIRSGKQLPIEDMIALAELLSARRIQEGSAIRLSAEEWEERLETISAKYPEHFSLDWPRDDVVSWHENQIIRARREENWFAAEWHDVAHQRLTAQEGKSRRMNGMD